ncbi:hypothetical protein BKH43_00615 [Helicobacter sp. 13S00401-1]|uniref:metallophosphoesterase n=1 Tax=Helicobacter sp. 13S00401-1 TaxID=1905758 RepID=UPI000BA730B2|nr:metallophosphoesterase [Helicobacter sp. 13S00401-1]PAF51772.1 hypothetical protein BKH43_00615 [Helicobacter sp. 13S00401-1]
MKITLDTFVISDTHFAHKQVLKKEPLRIKELQASDHENFDELSVSRWNAAVKSTDKVLHLGDLYYSEGMKYVNRLNGKKMLIVGNNDIGKLAPLKDWEIINKLKIKLDNKASLKEKLKSKFGKKLKDVYANALVTRIAGEVIMFSHFPVFERKKNERFCNARDIIDYLFTISGCTINVHGHIHSRTPENACCINVSTEQLNFTPTRLGDLLAKHRGF